MLGKIILIVFILLAFRFAMNLYRVLSSSKVAHNSGHGNSNNVNVGREPNPNQEKKDFDGGEYIDYEEVK